MTRRRYRGALIAFIVVLFCFLLIEASLVAVQQGRLLTDMTRDTIESELDLMSDAFYESLLKADYITIRTFIQRWGESHDELVLIRALSPNGFVVGEFRRPPSGNARTYSLTRTLRHEGMPLLTLELVGDHREAEAVVAKLRTRLFAGAVLFTAVLGTVLWYSQRRMALIPLEQEIALRQQAEKRLQEAHDALETKVRERTADLERELEERKRVEAELVRKEERVHLLLNSTAEGIYGIDTNGGCTFCNPSGLRMLAYEREADVIGRNMHTLIHHKRPDGTPYPEQDCKIYQAFRTTQPCHVENEVFWRSDGSRVPVEYWSYPLFEKGAVIGAVVTFIDISARKRLETQLVQSQKMEAIGTLAGGVAHDFNNILTAIIGYGSILQRKMGDEDPLKKNVHNILDSAQRAARLTKSLLTFGRKQVMAPLPVDLNSVVRRVEKLLVPLIGEDVELRTDLSEADLVVKADAGQIEQVLMNLAANARDAMPGGGCFTVRSEQTLLDDEQAHLHGVPAPGAYAVLSVSDTGTGMDEETRTKIFEPFFTTKEVGKGTGLGLAIAYGIIKQHSGIITVYSEQGKGSTFKIYLPLLNKAASAEEPVDKEALSRGGTEVILIAEDDQAVRELMRSVLRESGYTVIESTDGEEAVQNFTADQDRIRLVILDTIMPKMNGKEAYEAIRRIKPDIKSLFMSGYTADIISRQGLLNQGFDLMQKPLSPAELLARVRKTLDT
ncbi:MAG: response regulator [Nitrospirota bacterium]|nr:response regulator [Nitrospirota bacterium]